ncbi:MAG: MFS transporter [Proteobacteria bacterium]|nr:MFS transporter [Pseudomonadota bacterium]
MPDRFPSAPAGSSGLRPHLGGLGVLALCFLMLLLVRGMADAYGVIVLPLQRSFGWSRGEIASAYSLAMVVSGLLSLVSGWMFDRWGPRAIYTSGLAAVGLGVGATGFGSEIWHLWISLGLLLGFALAALGPSTAAALVSRWFRERLGTAVGCVMAANGLGIMAVVPLAQVAVDALGWRDAYRLMGAAALALLVPLSLLPWRRIAGGRADRAPAARPASGADLAPWTLARAARDPGFLGLLLLFTATAFSFPGIYVHMVPYFIEAGFPPLEAAAIFGACGLLAPAGALVWGMLADRMGLRSAMLLSIALSAGALLVLPLLGAGSGVGLAGVFVVLFGGTQTARSPVVLTLTARLFAGRRLGTINGVFGVGGGLAIGLGSWLNGAFHDLLGSYAALPWLSLLGLAVSVIPLFTVRALARQ